MPPVFLSGASRWLLVLHALNGLALLGSSTHLALAVVSLLRGRRTSLRMIRVQSQVVVVLFAVTFVVGLLMYPHFRVMVRGLGLDRDAPWASNLFDIKENFALLGLPLSAVLFSTRHRVEPGAPVVPFFAVCAFACWGLVAFAAISGLVVTSVRGI